MADRLLQLVPGHPQAARAQGNGFQACGGLGQLGLLTDGESGASLIGTGAVLSNALVDGLVIRGNAGDGQSPGGREREEFKFCWTLKWTCRLDWIPLVSRVCVGQLDVAARRQKLAIFQPDQVWLWDTGSAAAEDGTAPCWSGDGLRPLDKLWRSLGDEDMRGQTSAF